jgi:hypothetical protein
MCLVIVVLGVSKKFDFFIINFSVVILRLSLNYRFDTECAAQRGVDTALCRIAGSRDSALCRIAQSCRGTKFRPQNTQETEFDSWDWEI